MDATWSLEYIRDKDTDTAPQVFTADHAGGCVTFQSKALRSGKYEAHCRQALSQMSV